MPPNGKMRQVIQTGAFHAPVVEQKAKWFDQIDLDPKTGGEPQQGTGVLRYVGLKQGEAQITSCPCQVLAKHHNRIIKYSMSHIILRQSVA